MIRPGPPRVGERLAIVTGPRADKRCPPSFGAGVSSMRRLTVEFVVGLVVAIVTAALSSSQLAVLVDWDVAAISVMAGFLR
jgi:hypothetical protein